MVCGRLESGFQLRYVSRFLLEAFPEMLRSQLPLKPAANRSEVADSAGFWVGDCALCEVRAEAEKTVDCSNITMERDPFQICCYDRTMIERNTLCGQAAADAAL